VSPLLWTLGPLGQGIEAPGWAVQPPGVDEAGQVSAGVEPESLGHLSGADALGVLGDVGADLADRSSSPADARVCAARWDASARSWPLRLHEPPPDDLEQTAGLVSGAGQRDDVSAAPARP
jgi:hypothetical protein